MANGSVAPFKPITNATVSASTTSTNVALGTAGDSVMVYNASNSTAFVNWGSNTVVATTSHFPVPAGSRTLLDIGSFNSLTHVAVVLGTGSGTVYLNQGSGSVY